jgi:hypothetical protein
MSPRRVSRLKHPSSNYGSTRYAVRVFAFPLSFDATSPTQYVFVLFDPPGRTILRDVEVSCYGGPIRLAVTRLPRSWVGSPVPVLNPVPSSGVVPLTSLNTSVLFSCVTPQSRVFHYGPDRASWSFGPEDAFYLTATAFDFGVPLRTYFLVRFRVIYC